MEKTKMPHWMELSELNVQMKDANELILSLAQLLEKSELSADAFSPPALAAYNYMYRLLEDMEHIVDAMLDEEKAEKGLHSA